MKRTLLLFTGLLFTAGVATAQSLAFTDVTVIDVAEGTTDSGMTVVVADDRIMAVGTTGSLDVPADATVFDGTGKYVIPGLWDMHVHSAASVGWHFPLFLAHGVTGVKNMHSTVDAALALTTDIQSRLKRGEVLGPRFLASGPVVDGAPPLWPGSVTVRTEAEAQAAVDSLADGGADFIKVYDHLMPEAYFAVAEQARRRAIPIDGHVPYRVQPEAAARAGQRTDEHMLGLQYGCSTHADSVRAAREEVNQRGLSFLDRVLAEFTLERALYDTRDPALCEVTLAAYRESGMAVVPNLIMQHNHENARAVLADTASMRFVPQAMRPQWAQRVGGPVQDLVRPTAEARRDNVRLMREADVLILAGTDVGNPMLVPGLSLHQELALLVEAGLTPLEALRSATLNPARVLGTADSLGTVEAGKLADFVLLDANPLEDITNTRRIRAVVADGRLFDRAALDALLADAERNAGE